MKHASKKAFLALAAAANPASLMASPLADLPFLSGWGFEIIRSSSEESLLPHVEEEFDLMARRKDGASILISVYDGLHISKSGSLKQAMAEAIGSAVDHVASSEPIGFSGYRLSGQISRSRPGDSIGSLTTLRGLANQTILSVDFIGPKKLTERGFLEDLPANYAEEIVERVYRESSARLTGRRLSLVGVKTLGGRHVPAMKCSRTGVLYGDLKVWSMLQNMDTPTVKSPGLLHLKGPRGSADLILGSQEAVVKGKRQTFGSPVAWKDGKWWAPQSMLDALAR